MIMERHVQQLVASMPGAYKDWEKNWTAFEARLGNFPPKRYYSVMSGPEVNGTMVWEREWESFAAAEREYNRMFSDPELQRIQSLTSPIASERTEFYFVEV